MAQYLTQEWADQMTEAVNNNAAFVKGVRGQNVVMMTTVTGGPLGDVTYHVAVEDGKTRFGLGEPPSSDAQAVVPYDIAVKVQQGEMPPAAAMMTGKMSATGDVMKVMSLAPSLDLLPDIDEELGTTF